MSAADPTLVEAAGCADASVESSLGWALGTVLRAYAGDAALALGDLPGGPRGFHVLSAAAQDFPCSQQALGKFVGVDRSVMTYLVDDLIAAGLVERQPDPADRRARRVVVTPAGRERVEVLRSRLDAVDDHALRELEPTEREQFREALLRLARSASVDPRSRVDTLA